MTQALHRHRRQSPGTCAARDAITELTWAELANRVARFAGALVRDGLVQGDRVAMLARNEVDYMVYVLGTFWAGGVINPVNWRWTPAEIAHSLVDCETRFLIVSEEFADLVEVILPAAPCVKRTIVKRSSPGAHAIAYHDWLAGADPLSDSLRRGDDLAAIMYTGGTTGRAKGVMLSHNNLAASVFGMALATDEPAAARVLHVAPLFHIGALMNLFTGVSGGAASYFLPSFEPVSVIQAIERWQITELFLVPTMISMVIHHPDFASHDVSCLKRLRYGAAPIDERLLDEAMAAFPDAGFVQGYGMTELSPVATILPPADHLPQNRTAARLRSAGRATPTCEVRVVGPDDRELPVGEVGEIAARGPNVMLGYWGLPEETAKVIRDGWMYTGDIGMMDADGYVTIVDRSKDMIVTGGENVYSTEVENAIATHGDVAAVAVIAVKDIVWGERVHAVIVPRRGASPPAESIVEHCRGTLAGYKIPRSMEFTEELPLSAAGKVLKNILRAKASAEASRD
ncbi:long-chain-fatty-acid--CoA ligase [Rhizorhapis sp. SPR117]|uniref:long-chain-fatty-acid--CoA ligase n=1 Tax=Rhizorhapis sp. SPR117 TaxID=2912611 RepID=UPI001F2CED6C|nr:long-chain-fatty-acid--CoA ligase [Rhizorhapis sp. SPR117]